MSASFLAIKEKLHQQRPRNCPDSIWNKFLNFFSILCKIESSEFPELIYWYSISGEECLEVSYTLQELTIYIDHKSIEMCDNKIGRWYSQREIISLGK
uniref:Uncharacterized protein n=1 Tax=Marseillevirus LCMAC101 TaxID=2506602 RepID=A0A481YQS3_9VIRU|nr:MAG: hypothetical protein LCMAC101_01290 [Marseillevirus LCMAC101]